MAAGVRPHEQRGRALAHQVVEHGQRKYLLLRGAGVREGGRAPRPDQGAGRDPAVRGSRA